jgi:hypothetical protein
LGLISHLDINIEPGKLSGLGLAEQQGDIGFGDDALSGLPNASQPQDPAGESDILQRRLSHDPLDRQPIDLKFLRKRLTLLISSDPKIFVGLAQDLGSFGAMCLQRTSIEVATSLASSQPATFGIAIIDVDSIGGIAQCYLALRELRDTCPRLIVALVSSKFGHDDLDHERLPLCDASLMAPCSVRTIITQSAHLKSNNQFWQTKSLKRQNHAY